MFVKLKRFWNTFWNALKEAYNKVFKQPIETQAQKWRDIKSINFLDIFVRKINNLCNTEATFDIESDSTQTERLKELCKDIEAKRFEITSNLLADGDYYIFPATNEKGEIYHSYLNQQQVRILSMDGDKITEAYGIIDWYVSNENRLFYLLRHHKLDINGTLSISYSITDELGQPAVVPKWEYLKDENYSILNANHIGFGRYKSPIDSRGYSPVYGVPMNFGCDEIEQRIFNDLKLIEDEFNNGKSVIFTDPRNLLRDEEKKQYTIADNIIPIRNMAGISNFIDIFNPNLRFSEHYSKLVADMGLYEKQVGTSKGILTDNETTETATATAVKRANADTLALLNKIRTAIDAGNQMTLEADSVFLNISSDLWTYSSDWFDPFEDPAEQWQRLIEAKSNGVAEDSDLIRWIFPNLSNDEIDEKIVRIKEERNINTDEAIERILNNG